MLFVSLYKHIVIIFSSYLFYFKTWRRCERCYTRSIRKNSTSLPNYQFRGLKTWMARIATNHAIDYKRKKARESEELSLCKEAEENIKSSHNIEALLLTKEQKLLIAQKLRELPENYRDVVLAHYLEEKKLSRNCFTGKHRSKNSRNETVSGTKMD